MKPSIAVIMGGKPHDAPGSSPDLGDGGEGEYDHLSPKELESHGEDAAEAFGEACEKGDNKGAWEAFKAMHSVAHALWDQGGEGDDEDEEAPASGEEDEEEGK